MKKNLFVHLSPKAIFWVGIFMFFGATLNAQTPFTITWTGLTGSTNATGVPTGINIIQQYTGVVPSCVTSSNGATTSYTAVIQAAPGYDVTITSIGGSAYASGAGSRDFSFRLTNGATYTQTPATSITSGSSCGGANTLNTYTIPAAGQLLAAGNSATITVLRAPGSASGGGYSWTNRLTITGVVTPVSSCTAPTLSRTITDVTCNGGTNGSIDLTTTGGTSPFSYSWNGPSTSGVTSQDLTGRAPGVYTVVVTATGGCTVSATATIAQPSAIVPVISSTTAARCNGETSGGVDLSVSGGTPGYTYLWTDGTITQDLTNAGAGSYTVTVTDANTCTKTISATVTEPTLLNLTTTHTDVTCNAVNDGTIDLTVTGGNGTYDYEWSTTSILEDISGLTAGTYSVTATDILGCTGTTSVIISEPSAIVLATTNTQVSCNGLNDGAIDLSVSGGVPSYDYSWSNADTTEDISALAPGNYIITVTDTTGCTGTDTISITEPAQLALSDTAVNVSCNAMNDGSIDLTVAGGTFPYGYNWSNAETTEDISSLAPGTYDVTVTDDHGCTQSASISITEPAVLTASATFLPVSCNDGSNGSIDLTVTGGTAAYDYSWSNTETTEDISGLTAGNYDVTITDANGCTGTSSVTITEPAALTLTYTQVNEDCNAAGNGSIDLTVTGGTPSYDFSWSNADTTEDIAALSAGTYDVTVTDNNSCAASVSVTITAPSTLVLSATTDSVSCYGGNNGSIDLSVSGGTPSYDFSWSNADTTEDITAITAGTYDVTVTDDNGCTASITATVDEPAQLSMLTDATGESCAAGNDGTVDLTVTGGTGAYGYSWSNSETTEDLSGLAAGTYDVTVTDENGCTNTASAIVLPPPVLTLTTTQVNVACNSGDNGSIDLTVSGGTPAYDFDWSNGASTEDIAALAAGTYNVTVTDINSCTGTTSVVITEPGTATSSTNATACNLYTSPSGLYTWTTSGVYTDTLTTGAGCDSIVTINLTINTINTTVTTAGVTLSAAASGAVYQWLNCDNDLAPIAGATSQTFDAPATGNYAVKIEQSGCTDTSACHFVETLGMEQNAGLHIKLYPNPNEGVFSLDITGLYAENLNIEMTDLTGKAVYSTSTGATGEHVILPLNVAELPAGIYLLKAYTKDAATVVRIVRK